MNMKAAYEYWDKPDCWDDIGEPEDCVVKVGKARAGRDGCSTAVSITLCRR